MNMQIYCEQDISKVSQRDKCSNAVFCCWSCRVDQMFRLQILRNKDDTKRYWL